MPGSAAAGPWPALAGRIPHRSPYVWARGESPVIRDVRVPAPGRGYLEPDGGFGFEIGGLRLDAQVCELVAGIRLAWSGLGVDISTYHTWVVSGDPGGSRVTSRLRGEGAAAIALRETDPGARSGRSTGGSPT